MQCKKCSSHLTYLRLKTRERVCRSCGHVEKLKVKNVKSK